MAINPDDVVWDAPAGVNPADVVWDEPKKRTRISEIIAASMPGIAGAYGIDAIMGAKQTLDAVAQMAARATGRGVKDTEAANQFTMDAYQSTDPASRPGAGFVRGLGQAAVMAPATPAAAVTTLPRALGMGGATGGLAGALTPVYGAGDDFWQQKAKEAGKGAVLGAMLGGAGHSAGRVLAPETRPAAQALLEGDVRLSPGQAAGGWMNRLEEGVMSVPVVGDAIKGVRRKATEDFNRMAYNQALRPIGEKVTKADPVGYAGVEAVQRKISDRYDAVLDQIKIVKIDEQMGRTVGKLFDMADEIGVGDQLRKIVANQVQAKMTPAGTMSAETMKQVESVLGARAATLRRSSDDAQRELGKAVREVQTALRDAVARSAGPMRAQQLQKTNEAWSEFLRIEDAASKVGSREGIFTPEAFNVSVHKMAPKKVVSKGKATGQALADDALSVLGKTVPDSGTPYRGLAAALLGGAIEPTIATTGIAAMLPYTAPGRALTVGAMTQRPELVRAAGERIKELSPYLVPGSLAVFGPSP